MASKTPPKSAPSSGEISDPLLFKLFNQDVTKGDRRRLAILNACLDCLSERGFAETNLKTIGERLGIRRSHVAYHFAAMDDLLESLFQYMIECAQSITVSEIQRARDPKGQVKAYISAAFAWARRYPLQLKAMTLLYHLGTFNPRFHRLNSALRAGAINRIVGILRSMPRGAKVPGSELESLGRAIQISILGSLVAWASSNLSVSLATVEKQTFEHAWRLIQAVLEE